MLAYNTNMGVAYIDGLIAKSKIMEILEQYYDAVKNNAELKAKLFNTNGMSVYDLNKLSFIAELAEEIALVEPFTKTPDIQ